MGRTYKKMYQDAAKTKVIRQLTPTFLRWKDEGDQVIGAFVNVTAVTGRLGGKSYNQYIFDTDEGMVKFSMGGAADGEIGGSLVKGCIYAITYLGKERIEGGRSVNRFNVEEIGASDDLPDEEAEGKGKEEIQGKSKEGKK